MLTENFILMVDSYKASHHLTYPPGTDGLFSYIEARGSEEYDDLVFFGLQYYLKRYLSQRVTLEMVEEADDFFKAHGEPFPLVGWLRIVHTHGGRIPVRIRALPEGTIAPLSVPLVTVESTDPQIPWIASWIETSLLRSVWYPTTVATLSREVKRTIRGVLEATSDDVSELPFKLHDFGARGVSSAESAGIGGAAHLVNFMGSDTVEGALLVRRYYGCNMPSFSIPAAEHSSITSWGKEREVDAYRNMLTQFAKPGKLVAVVSDSYDIYNACSELWGTQLREEVIASGATVVIRPDSGDPATVVLKCAEILGEKFGFTTNTKGFKVLKHVRIIQGDGVNPESIHQILSHLEDARWSASNVAFGMGGALLQQVNRDTLQFAMKCSAIRVNGVWRDVYKEPATDATKNSKRGIVDTTTSDGDLWVTKLPRSDKGDTYINNKRSAMHTVFENGEIKKTWTFDEIRKRAEVLS